MNGVDLIIVLILIGGALIGLAGGALLELAIFVAGLVSLALAKGIYAAIAPALHGPGSRWAEIIVFLVLFVLIWGAISGVLRAFRRMIPLLFLGCIDRLLGIVFGLLPAWLIIEVLLYLGRHAPSKAIRHAISHSQVAHGFLQAMMLLDKLLPHLR